MGPFRTVRGKVSALATIVSAAAMAAIIAAVALTTSFTVASAITHSLVERLDAGEGPRCAGLGAGAGCGGYVVPLGGGGAAGQVCPLRTADGAIVVSIFLAALLGAGAGGTCGRGSVPLLAAGGRGRRLAGAIGQVCPFRTADGAGLVHRFRCAGRIT